MNTGLTDSQLTLLRTLCSHYPEIEKALIFGSRAKGTYKEGSDIDLAIKGKGVSHRTVTALHSDLEDSSLPYFVDVVAYETISNPALKEHIDRVGIEINNLVASFEKL